MKRIPECSKSKAFTLAEVPEARQYIGARSDAFTLAETLITLAIIGIVAAMTIPTLMTKFFDKAMESKYKKVKSSLINGYKLLLQKEEADDVADLPLVRCSKTNKACFENQHSGIFAGMSTDVGTLPKKYYLSDGTTESPFNWNDVPYIFTTKDGATLGVIPDDGLKTFSVYVDLNGNDEPNVQGRDLYKFRVSQDAKISDVSSELSKSLACSLSNPTACTTEEACMSLKNGAELVRGKTTCFSDKSVYHILWINNSCRAINNTNEQYHMCSNTSASSDSIGFPASGAFTGTVSLHQYQCTAYEYYCR